MNFSSAHPSKITNPKIARSPFTNERFAQRKITNSQIAKRSAAAVASLALLGICAVALHAQAALLQQRVAELKESTAKNKLALAQYTWVEKSDGVPEGPAEKNGTFSGA